MIEFDPDLQVHKDAVSAESEAEVEVGLLGAEFGVQGTGDRVRRFRFRLYSGLVAAHLRIVFRLWKSKILVANSTSWSRHFS